MNEPVESGAPESAHRQKALELVSQLRTLLALDQQKRAPEVLDEIGKATNLLAVYFSTEPDDTVALQCISMIGLAILKGSKEAAKRKPKTTRWAEKSPPTLEVLASSEERRAAVKFLSSITSGWVVAYAFREAADHSSDKQLVEDLLKWAGSAAASKADFIFELASILTVVIPNQAVGYSIILKAFSKYLNETRVSAGARFPDSILSLSSALDVLAKTYLADKKMLDIAMFFLTSIDCVSAQEPAVLFEPKIFRAMASLSMIAPGWGKGAEKVLCRLGERIISIFLLSVQMHGIEGSGGICALMVSANNVLPIGLISKRFPAQRALINEALGQVRLGDGESPVGDVTLHDQIAALLVAWDAFRESLLDASATNEIEFLVESIAARARIERIGKVGEMETFHPLQHHVIGGGELPPVSVRINVPGVRIVRDDGSFRVLIKALTEPVK